MTASLSGWFDLLQVYCASWPLYGFASSFKEFLFMFTYLHCLQIFDISLLHCFIMMNGYFVLHCSAGVPCALCLKWGLEVIFHAPLPSTNSFPFSPSSFYCSGFSLFVSFLLPNFLLEVVASLFLNLYL